MFGLSIGFVGAYVAHDAAERLGSEPDRSPVAEVLGAIDYDSFCRRGETDLRAVSLTADAYGWRCSGVMNGIFGTDDIDVQEACEWQYGVAAVAFLEDADSPDGWPCVDRR